MPPDDRCRRGHLKPDHELALNQSQIATGSMNGAGTLQMRGWSL